MSSTLLDLPPELRLHIFALTLPTSLEVPDPPSSLHHPSLTRVSQQLRHEVLHLFYSQTTFYIRPFSLLWAFVHELGDEWSAWLRDVRVMRGFWSWDRRWLDCGLGEGVLKREMWVGGEEGWRWMDKGEFERFWRGVDEGQALEGGGSVEEGC